MTVPAAMAAESAAGPEGARIYHPDTAAFNARLRPPYALRSFSSPNRRHSTSVAA